MPVGDWIVSIGMLFVWCCLGACFADTMLPDLLGLRPHRYVRRLVILSGPLGALAMLGLNALLWLFSVWREE